MDDGFVTAVGPDGNKRRVPQHYLDNPAFGFKLPPSTRAQEPAETGDLVRVEEPSVTDPQLQMVEEPAASANPRRIDPARPGKTKEARS